MFLSLPLSLSLPSQSGPSFQELSQRFHHIWAPLKICFSQMPSLFFKLWYFGFVPSLSFFLNFMCVHLLWPAAFACSTRAFWLGCSHFCCIRCLCCGPLDSRVIGSVAAAPGFTPQHVGSSGPGIQQTSPALAGRFLNH